MDMEKVIKALEDFNKNRICLPHLIPWDEIADAIALLKEKQGNRLKIASEMAKGSVLMYQGKELVRCKDCIHGKQLFADYISCQISEENESGCHVSHKPDWFCADGECKEVK